MRQYLVKRTGQAVLTAVAVVTLSFALVRLMPGNPADQLRGQLIRNNPDLSQQEINRRVANYINIDLSQPIHEQYLSYVGGILQGDLGQSISQNAPVSQILGEALPWTVFAFSIAILDAPYRLAGWQALSVEMASTCSTFARTHACATTRLPS